MPTTVETFPLPGSVDESVFTPPASSDDRHPHRLLFVGAVRNVKGLDILVRALPRVVGAHPEVRLRVVGEPFRRAYQRDEEEVRTLVDELGLADRVEFVGGRSPEGVAREMQRAAALVLPSRRDSFPTVVLEAMACGTPIIATRSGGAEESVTENTGILVPPEDPQALARAIDHFLSGRVVFDPDTLRDRAVSNWGRSATQETALEEA